MNTNNCIKEINKVFLQEIITVEITKYDETNSKYLSYLFYTKDGVYIGDKTFIRLDGINDILRMKIKNNKVNNLKEDDKKELDRLLSLYENMGFSIKE